LKHSGETGKFIKTDMSVLFIKYMDMSMQLTVK